MLCDAYENLALSLAAAPDLSRQSKLTEALRDARPVLSPATADRVIQSLREIAPVLITGFGPTCNDRTGTEISWRRRRSQN